MIRLLKNIWLFRKELRRWKKDDWVYTEELLHKALAEMNDYLKPNHPELTTVVNILNRRASWYYDSYKDQNLVPAKFSLKRNPSGKGFILENDLTDEQQQNNLQIRKEQQDYRDSDFKFMLEQISLNADKWFL